ncbi:MAG: ZIP family metal transporter [archaeon]|jgi:zinc and cadmium transporter|nr:ZIP family metal transporter [archaeon]
MNGAVLYSILSVLIISLISFVGLLFIGIRQDKLKKILIYLISFSAGALLGDAFIHLLPETISNGFTTTYALFILLGILIFFGLEKIVKWQHCHMPVNKQHVHSLAYMNIIGDSLHNFLDGIIIAASYLINLQAGIATTIAVLFHELPQEIGDFGVLIYSGLKKKKALIVNFLTALTAVLGAAITLLLQNSIENLNIYLTLIAIGGFIYIASSDLIPELHKETKISISIMQIVAFILGVLVMIALLALG